MCTDSHLTVATMLSTEVAVQSEMDPYGVLSVPPFNSVWSNILRLPL